MTDPVVSYRYGKRPIIDVPAFLIPSQQYSSSHKTVPSLQNLHEPLRPPQTVEVIPADNTIYPRSYHTAPPADPFHYNQYQPYDKTRDFPYDKTRDFYYGPQGEPVKPLQRYFEPHLNYPGVVVPPQPPPPPPPPPPPAYPLPPPNPHYHIHPPPNYTRQQQPPQEFDINCDLEYGRVAKISVRESKGHFRGIPEYLRKELTKCYGRYPSMSVKIKYHDGDFHIFANHNIHRKRRDRLTDEHEEYERDQDYERGTGTYGDVIPPRQMDRAPRDSYRDMDKDAGWESYR